MHKISPYTKTKRNPEILEDATFYQDLTYIAIMENIEKESKLGNSYIIKKNIGEYMIYYLRKKKFKVSVSSVFHSDTYYKISW